MRKLLMLSSILISACSAMANIISANYISTVYSKEYFSIVGSKTATPVWMSSSDYKGVIIATKNLQEDIFKVTGKTPEIFIDTIPSSDEILIIGTLGKSTLIDSLVNKNIIDTTGLTGKWEKFYIQTIEEP
jgi:hypothetical protein